MTNRRKSSRRRGRRRRRDNSKKIMLVIGAVIILCALVAGGIMLHLNGVVNKYPEGSVLPGVYLSDQDLGGMTSEQVYALIDADIELKGGATITLNTTEPEKSEKSATLSEFGFQASNRNKIVEDAISYGKNGSTLTRYNIIKKLQKERVVYEIDYDLNEQMVDDFVEANYGEMQKKSVNPSLKMVDGNLTIESGENGVIIDVDKTVDEIIAFIETNEAGESGVIQVPSIVVEPEVQAKSLESVKDVLGSYTTNASTSGGRYKNLQRGMELLNGITLMPGESISIQETTSPYTEENGYYKAGAYSNGEVIESYAGGVCQVCTTTYNAVLMAELEIKERYGHSMTVSYVDPARDAAIAGDYKDLVFTNNTNNAIYIDTNIYAGELRVTIYGEETRPENRTIKYKSITTVEPYSGDVTFKADSSAEIGHKSKISSGHSGTTAQLWKYVYVDGVEESSTKINTSTYRASGNIYSVGTKSEYSEATAIVASAIQTQDSAKIDKAIASAKSLIAEKKAAENAPVQPEPEPEPQPESQPEPEPEPQPESQPEPESDDHEESTESDAATEDLIGNTTGSAAE